MNMGKLAYDITRDLDNDMLSKQAIDMAYVRAKLKVMGNDYGVMVTDPFPVMYRPNLSLSKKVRASVSPSATPSPSAELSISFSPSPSYSPSPSAEDVQEASHVTLFALEYNSLGLTKGTQIVLTSCSAYEDDYPTGFVTLEEYTRILNHDKEANRLNAERLRRQKYADGGIVPPEKQQQAKYNPTNESCPKNHIRVNGECVPDTLYTWNEKKWVSSEVPILGVTEPYYNEADLVPAITAHNYKVPKLKKT